MKQADEILDKSDIEKNDSDDTDSDNDNSDTQDNLSDAHEMISRLKKVICVTCSYITVQVM
jgi:hypothetical protein